MSEKNLVLVSWENEVNKRTCLKIIVKNSIDYFWDKINHLLKTWLWVIENDKKIFSRIFWWFDLLWWKYCANRIDLEHSLSEEEIIEALNDWIYLLHTDRQKDKAIIILLWIMLSNYARKAIRKTWPLDAETDINDLFECVNRFQINDEMIEKSINFARIRYKNDYNEEVPKIIYNRLNNEINID